MRAVAFALLKSPPGSYSGMSKASAAINLCMETIELVTKVSGVSPNINLRDAFEPRD